MRYLHPGAGLDTDTSQYYGKLRVCVADNASEMPSCGEQGIKVIHNPNTGGSGGFRRGIEEFRRDQQRENVPDTTHAVFMDDGIEITGEALYRLYEQLSFCKEEYRRGAVAGRMFRTDHRQFQYTVAMDRAAVFKMSGKASFEIDAGKSRRQGSGRVQWLW